MEIKHGRLIAVLAALLIACASAAHAATLSIAEDFLLDPSETAALVDEAAKASPSDVRLKLVQAALYLDLADTRIDYKTGEVRHLNPEALARAEKALSEALKLDPNNPLVYYYSGQFVAMRTGDPTKAAGYFHKYLELAPADIRAYRKLHAIYLVRKEYSLASALLMQAIEVLGDKPELYQRLAITHLAMGEHKQAEKFAQKALSMEEDNETRVLMAEALARQGKKKSARLEFEAVIKREPGNINALTKLAELYLGEGNLNAARTFARRAATFAPDHPDVISINKAISNAPPKP